MLPNKTDEQGVLFVRVYSCIVGDTFEMKDKDLEVGDQDDSVYEGREKELGFSDVFVAVQHLDDRMGGWLIEDMRVWVGSKSSGGNVVQ